MSTTPVPVSRPKVKPPLWTAARDGIGHAVLGRSFNTVCGKRATLERLGWPITQRCRVCVAGLEATTPMA